MPTKYLHIGGLIAVGFDPSEQYMLAVSHNGRGVFRTESWERVARDYALAYPSDGHSIGIGPIDGAIIPVSEMCWDTVSERIITSPTGRFTLRCESSGIELLHADDKSL